MAGITQLDDLLKSLSPHLLEPEFVFCSVTDEIADYVSFDPVATFKEAEGLTLVLEKSVALDAGLAFDGSFKQITLTVHSSLDAVGLTAAVATKLASKGISANVIAAFYHDHIFVPSAKAEDAIAALRELSV
ncbi:ACT domain-containing protein [Vibrio mytili]|uniref:Transporter n=1 Tax=Vibrio mytili TaxID=50718 RepID=A0A0C3I2J0_9VIBR|nr:ACT domain-containing protein [Vibrio mytili]KIN09305.1 transporter [Vibrio mytili]